MKKIIKFILNTVGYKLSKIENVQPNSSIYSTFSKQKKIVDLDVVGNVGEMIPGMVTKESGKFLFSLCYMQEIEGDVVEIGSWQGKSASFLARAVKESNNGQFYAIDHFKGNVGKEHFYATGKQVNIKDVFIENITKVGLKDCVNLLDMENTAAAKILEKKSIRFLFIDGDHTFSGVSKDIKLFLPMLKKGSIVIFDDYFKGFPGLIEAVDDFLQCQEVSRIFYYRHTLVVKI